MKVIKKLKEVFKMGETQKKKFTYVGFELSQTFDGITLRQDKYINEKIELFEVPAERRQQPGNKLTEEEVTQLCRVAGKVSWVSGGCRPDVSFIRVKLSTKFRNATVKDLIAASKEYLGKAWAADRRQGVQEGEVGRVEQKLISLGPIQGIVSGKFGEVVRPLTHFWMYWPPAG